MSNLRIERVDDDDATLQDWQYVHNLIVPPAALSLDEVRERAQRNQLEVAYLDDVLVGCTTVRPPATDDPSTATVIARVLPDHRGQGFGRELYERGLEQARKLGADVIETVVLAANTDGLRFAQALSEARGECPGASSCGHSPRPTFTARRPPCMTTASSAASSACSTPTP